MQLRFTKYHGLGNDFVLIDHRDTASLPKGWLTDARVKQLCDRRFGVGCDQLLLLEPPQAPGQDAFFAIRNADGSLAEMCGNGIRCAALHLYRHGARPNLTKYTFGTLAGDKAVEVRQGVDESVQVRVDMGPPKILKKDLKNAAFLLDTGVPHAVVFCPKISDAPVTTDGPRIEHDSEFGMSANVNFVETVSPLLLKVCTWERGAGATLACGTGACASAVGAVLAGRADADKNIQVELPGGKLTIKWSGKLQDSVWMTGPAIEVFTGAVTVD
jgi:diaminopimelate epimerase